MSIHVYCRPCIVVFIYIFLFLCVNIQVSTSGFDDEVVNGEFVKMTKAFATGASANCPPLPLTALLIQVLIIYQSCLGSLWCLALLLVLVGLTKNENK